MKTEDKGVRGDALAWRSKRTIQTRVRTGQRTGSLLRPRPITSPQMPFFCKSKVKEANVEQQSCASE